MTIRQRQSLPLPMRDLSELQHSTGGAVPFEVLLVAKFMQGANVVIIEGVHGVVIWDEAGEKNAAATRARARIRRWEAMGNAAFLVVLNMKECVIKSFVSGGGLKKW